MPKTAISIKFYLPTPTTLNKKKLKKSEIEDLIGSYHSAKPDIDNLFKGFVDSLLYTRKIGKIRPDSAFGDNDCTIGEVYMAKYWCRKGDEHIEVEIFDKGHDFLHNDA
jgi:Holliday junction resolvase RusA-like endonuclease